MIVYKFRPSDRVFDGEVELPDGPSIPSFHTFQAPPVQDGYYAVMNNGWELVEGSAPTDPSLNAAPPPPAVPDRASMVVTAFQAKAALLQAGRLSSVESLVNASGAPKIVSLAYNNASEWRRLSPMVLEFSQFLGYTDEELDELFDIASKIEV